MNRTEITERPRIVTTLKSYDATSFESDGGWHLGTGGVDLAELGVKPGAQVEEWGRGYGFTVRGCAIDGHVLWYRTEAEDQAHHQQMLADQAAEQRARFESDRDRMDAEYEALPDVFRRRIDRFRAGNPDFRWEHEGYEMATCAAALIMAEGDENDPRLDALGLSGNQWGFAKRLAHWYVNEPENVVLEHGAMVPLVGCEKYGCTHPVAAVGVVREAETP